MARLCLTYKAPFICKKTILYFMFLVVLSAFLSSCGRPPKFQVQQLENSWHISGNSIELNNIVIPAEIHLALADAGFIPDPFIVGVEKELQWVSRQQWVWESEFEVEKEMLSNDSIALVFDGIDTYAQVFLNDEPLFYANNMFRSWRIPVKEKLLETTNRLKIIFPPSPQIIDSLAQVASVKLPDDRAFMRKAAYQAGWDWAPEYRTAGLWKKLRLESWSRIRVDQLSFLQKEVNEQEANLLLMLTVEAAKVRSYKVQLFAHGRKLLDDPIHLKQGENEIRLPFAIQNPDLWWPNGLGEQVLTEFELKLFDGNEIIFEEKTKLGFRSIQLVQEEDSIGQSFYFEINGVPIYAKGANYVPEDMFPTRMNRAKTRKLLIDAKSAGMNMLRVWGGGIYPEDYFYDLCDSLGLLVWQDFMFANTLYPADSAFLQNVKIEISQQLQRLRGRTSLALWCGNNEIDEGFVNWGWQQQLDWSEKQSDSLWNNYQQLFESLIPDLIDEYDPHTTYWPSSPSGGWGHDESYLSGDVHYWGVWWGEEPFELYQQKIGRFNSEFGFQAMPDMATLISMVGKDLLWPRSPHLEYFQKHPRGTALINDYMQRDFPVPKSIEDYTYMSQLVQMQGLELAIEAQRLSRPHSMGTLFWQLNDAWPSISWSVIDYFGRPKAAYYSLERLYSTILIGAETDKNKATGIFLNETQKTLSARATFDLLDFEGNVLQSASRLLVLKPGEVQRLDAGFATDILQNINPRKVWMRVRYMLEGKILAEKFHFFTQPKNLILPRHEISLSLMPKQDHIEIVLSSPVFLKNLELTSNDINGRWETNFFDLSAGRSMRINFYPSGEIKTEKLRFETNSLNEVME